MSSQIEISQISKRNNLWLEEKLYSIWEDHFADVPRKNLVLIKFGKGSKRQLGSIKWANSNSKIKSALKKLKEDWQIADDKRISIITITKHFQDPAIPDFIPIATIAHELVHYTHGFHSPLPQIVDHPHRGNIVKKELTRRGLGDVYLNSEKWLKANWVNYLKAHKAI